MGAANNVGFRFRILITIPALCLVLWRPVGVPFCVSPALTRKSVEVAALFIAFFLTDLNCSRIPLLVDYIDRSSPPLWFRYYIVNWTRTNITSPPSLAPPASFDALVDASLAAFPRDGYSKSAELLAKFCFALNFFLANTSAPWFWRGTDDVVINFRKLKKFVRNLRAQHDPVRESIYAGNCMTGQISWLHEPFMQGGAGYLMSRYACRVVANHTADLMLGSPFEEDQYFGHFLVKKLGVKGWQMTSPRFLGYLLRVTETTALIKRNYTLFPTCSKIEDGGRPRSGCGPFLRPLRDIVFFHQSCSDLSTDTFRLARAVFRARKAVMWWMKKYKPRICVVR